MSARTRVAIAEDHTMVAEGLAKLLEGEFELVGIAGNGRDLVNLVQHTKPDVVLLDFRMPILSGIEAARQIREVSSTTKIIIVTAHNEPEYIVEAFRAGASGYVLKNCAASELMTAIRQALDCRIYVTPMIAEHVVSVALNPKARRKGAELTSRQQEVLRLVAEGCTAKEIANWLNLSVKTAVFHKMAIMDKLGLHTTAELTRYALEHGLVGGSLERAAV